MIARRWEISWEPGSLVPIICQLRNKFLSTVPSEGLLSLSYCLICPFDSKGMYSSSTFSTTNKFFSRIPSAGCLSLFCCLICPLGYKGIFTASAPRPIQTISCCLVSVCCQGAAAVAVGDRWQMTRFRLQDTCDMWHTTCDRWHMTWDTILVTYDTYHNKIVCIGAASPHIKRFNVSNMQIKFSTFRLCLGFIF